MPMAQISGGRAKCLMSVEVLSLVEPQGAAGISKVNTVRECSNLIEHWPFISCATLWIIL